MLNVNNADNDKIDWLNIKKNIVLLVDGLLPQLRRSCSISRWEQWMTLSLGQKKLKCSRSFISKKSEIEQPLKCIKKNEA